MTKDTQKVKVEEKEVVTAPGERNYFQEVDWRVFTSEQVTILKTLAANKQPHLMAAALHHIRPDQEYQLQVLIDILTENDDQLESEVRQEILDEEKKGKKIATPEEEAAWQKKLDEEKKEHKAKVAKRKKEFYASKKKEIEK